MVKREARLTQAPDGEMEMLAACAAAVRGWRAHGNCSRSLREVVQSSGRASASPALAGSAGSEQEWFRTMIGSKKKEGIFCGSDPFIFIPH